MKSFKREISRLLDETGWAVAIVESETDEWLDERWVIRSVRQKWGMELHLHFLVKHDDDDIVYCVTATNQRLREQPTADASIAVLYVHDDEFDQKLVQFFSQIERFREKFKMY